MTFSRPGSMKGDEIKALVIHIQAGAQDFFKIQLLWSAVYSHNASGNDIRVLKNTVAKQDFQPKEPIGQSDNKRLGFPAGRFPFKSGRHIGNGRFSVYDFVALIGQFADPVSAFAPHLQAGIPEISRAPYRVFKTETVHEADFIFHKSMLRIFPFRHTQQIKAVAVVHLFSVIHMAEILIPGHPHQIGGVRCVKLKDFLFFIYLNSHCISLRNCLNWDCVKNFAIWSIILYTWK